MIDGRKSNFKASKHQFLALLAHEHNDVNALNEHIEPWLINEEKKWKIESLIGYVEDCELHFKKMRSFKENKDVWNLINQLKADFRKKYIKTENTEVHQEH